jgi:hypothetical protein
MSEASPSPKTQAMKAYEQTTNPSLTEQLLYAMLTQLEKINHHLKPSSSDDKT